jgi:hypothetical protein
MADNHDGRRRPRQAVDPTLDLPKRRTDPAVGDVGRELSFGARWGLRRGRGLFGVARFGPPDGSGVHGVVVPPRATVRLADLSICGLPADAYASGEDRLVSLRIPVKS